jgi:hypothetical protein
MRGTAPQRRVVWPTGSVQRIVARPTLVVDPPLDQPDETVLNTLYEMERYIQR